MFDDIIKDCKNRWEKEAKFLNHIYELVDEGEMPCFLYKYGKEVHYRPLVDINSNYSAHRSTGKCMVIGSTGYSFKGNFMKRIDRENLKKIRDMDTQIIELQNKKQEMLKEAWRKNKKLTWQFAEEWYDVREDLLKQFHLKED